MVNSKVEWCNINNSQLQKLETIAEVLSKMVNSRILPDMLFKNHGVC